MFSLYILSDLILSFLVLSVGYNANMNIKMNYEETRVILFYDSCLCYLLKEKFRKKHKVKVLSGKKDFSDYIYDKYPSEINTYFMEYTSVPIESINYKKPWIDAHQNEILDYLFSDISKLSKKLGISSIVLGTIFFYDDLPNVITKQKIFFNKKDIDLSEGEVAIIIDVKTNTRDIMELKKEAQKKLKNMYTLLGLKYPKKNKFVNPINHIDMTIYNMVEKELIDLYCKDKKTEDYGEGGFMEIAFERVAGKLILRYGELLKIDDEDDEFYDDFYRTKKTFTKVKNHYYALQSRYNLPTKNEIKSFLALL